MVGTNGLGVAAATAFAAAGLRNPAYRDSGAPPDSIAGFWSASSAVRTWALTLGLLASVARTGRPSAELLAVAGLVQLGDSALGVWQRDPRMATLPALMGIVHLRTARALSSRSG